MFEREAPGKGRSRGKQVLPKDTLTPRERQVIELVAQGYSTSDIAARLGCTPHAVRNYIWRASEKIGASNRVEIALFTLPAPGPRAVEREAPGKGRSRGTQAQRRSA